MHSYFVVLCYREEREAGKGLFHAFGLFAYLLLGVSIVLLDMIVLRSADLWSCTLSYPTEKEESTYRYYALRLVFSLVMGSVSIFVALGLIVAISLYIRVRKLSSLLMSETTNAERLISRDPSSLAEIVGSTTR